MARPSVWKLKMIHGFRGFATGEVVEVPTQVHPTIAERWLIDGHAELSPEPAENKALKRSERKVVRSA